MMVSRYPYVFRGEKQYTEVSQGTQSMEQKAKLTSKGQVTTPKAVRKALGIKESDSLLFDVEGSEEVRLGVERKPVSFADYEGVWREGRGMSWEEVNAYVRDLRGHDNEEQEG